VTDNVRHAVFLVVFSAVISAGGTVCYTVSRIDNPTPQPAELVSTRDWFASQALSYGVDADWPEEAKAAIMGSPRPPYNEDPRGALVWDFRCKAKLAFLWADVIALERNRARKVKARELSMENGCSLCHRDNGER
jgi:hypothetical protein